MLNPYLLEYYTLNKEETKNVLLIFSLDFIHSFHRNFNNTCKTAVKKKNMENTLY